MKKHYFILLLLFGLFCMPNSLYACGSSTNKTEKHSCKKENSSKSLKDCCCSKAKNKKHNGCGGKCGHSNCTTSTISVSSILNNEIELNLNRFDFFDKKEKFYMSETNTSNGFYSMWLIPKIS
ncbi:hypothetical protein [Flavobacterium sp. 102]|uniref:hypothetical protein n=1 Tax=Flavobacterium sp. 102 TaxID=2135623 RepID=UPI000EAFCD51|nr:hypothetical protein [Flavobacterium sp. 102]RKS02975.1 hypothetical protein C8C84_2713 [Flavobacterium sp. 102]